MAEELAEGEADDIAEAYLKAKFQKTKLWGIINVVRFCISETATMVGGVDRWVAGWGFMFMC